MSGKLQGISTKGLSVQLSSHAFGRVGLCEIKDSYTANPLEGLKEDDIVTCRILSKKNNKFDLSIRPSLTQPNAPAPQDPHISSAKELVVGNVYRGYIANVTDKGVFVSLGADVTARVQITNLSDLFIKDFKAVFQEGKLVRGRVLTIDGSKIELSLKASDVDPQVFKAPLTLQDLQPGRQLQGQVKKVESYGLFIILSHSNNLSGLCHISEVSEEFIQDLKALYKPGDIVKAAILKVDPETKRISLSLKAAVAKASDSGAAEGGISSSDEDEVIVQESRVKRLVSGERDLLSGTAPAIAPTISTIDAV